MATLMLSSLGSAVGGPLGAAVGGLIGQSVDKGLFGSAVRRGPRLGDLAVQTSSYGSMVPRIYGTMRVAGTVVWATDLREGDALQSAGKGQPDTLTYSYSVSLAVALSSRPLKSIGRIWADGQLLRGAAGDFKVQTQFRFYSGGEDQPVDPLIASIEGIHSSPAYRGLAMAVFEDLQLASFGNRIPVLTFEVEADQGEVSVGTILRDASSELFEVREGAKIGGYAAYGETIEAACAPLIDGLGVIVHDDGLRLTDEGPALPISVERAELGCSLNSERLAPLEWSHRSSADLPTSVSVTYYDPERDYQAGEQHVTNGSHAPKQQRIELPAAMTADTAKSLANSRLAQRWTERSSLKLRFPPKYVSLRPGATIRLAWRNDLWTVRTVSIEGLAVEVDLARQLSSVSRVRADAGRSQGAKDAVAQPTILAVVELPSASFPAELQVHIAASGGLAPWKPGPVRVTGAGLNFIAETSRRRAVIGSVSSPPGSSTSSLLDLENSIEVQVCHSDDWLESRDDEALAAGANLAAVGDEILQFGIAQPLGGGRFHLSRLLRARGGTEWATSGHKPGERFVLLEPAGLMKLNLPVSATGTVIALSPFGLADGETAAVEHRIGGAGIRPLSPVHLRVSRNADGCASVTWVRRSRLGASWNDGMDVPLGESQELYRVRLTGSLGRQERTTAASSCVFESSEIAAVGQGPVIISVAQMGDFGPSPDATALLTSKGEFE